MPVPEALLIQTGEKKQAPEGGTTRKCARQAFMPGVDILAVVKHDLRVGICLNELCRKDGGRGIGYGNGMSHHGVEVGRCEIDVTTFWWEPPKCRERRVAGELVRS